MRRASGAKRVQRVVPGAGGGNPADAILGRNLAAFYKQVDPGKADIDTHVANLMANYTRQNVATSLHGKYNKVPPGWEKFVAQAPPRRMSATDRRKAAQEAKDRKKAEMAARKEEKVLQEGGAVAIQAGFRGQQGRRMSEARKEEVVQETNAVRIQAGIRGRQGRRASKAQGEFVQMEGSAATIQAIARGRQGRRESEVKREELVMNTKASTIQAIQRGRQGRKIASQKAIEMATMPKKGKVLLHYNHYKEWLETTFIYHELDEKFYGSVSCAEVDDKFSFSYVFKGNYQVQLKGPGRTGPRCPRKDGQIISLEMSNKVDADGAIGLEYWAAVDEDEKAEEAALGGKKKITYTATGGGEGGISIQTDHGDGEFGEDRASCSCIEGNPCVSAYNCKNWANRYEVAKANGWKGVDGHGHGR
jgi:hypothetical protein